MQFQRLSPCGALGLHGVGRRLAAWREYASAAGRSQTYVLILLSALLGLSAAACSSGGPPNPSGTPNSARAERQTTIEQQVEQQQAQQQQSAEAPAQEVQAEAGEPRAAETETADAPAAEPAVEDQSEQTITIDEQVDEQLIERIAAGLAAQRAGLPVQRNALGDPEAPVLIVEYGDFQ